jgi:hypothetical protein
VTDVLECSECGRTSDLDAVRWCDYRSDLPAEAEAEDPETARIPAVVYFCPACAEREFDLD